MNARAPFVCGQCRELHSNWNKPCPHFELYDVLVSCDSELSAIAHGRPPSSKDELSELYYRCRKLYEGMR